MIVSSLLVCIVCMLSLLSRLAITPVFLTACMLLHVFFACNSKYRDVVDVAPFLTNHEGFLISEDNSWSWRWDTICGVSKATMTAEVAAFCFKVCMHVENGWEQDQIKVTSMLMRWCVYVVRTTRRHDKKIER